MISSFTVMSLPALSSRVYWQDLYLAKWAGEPWPSPLKLHIPTAVHLPGEVGAWGCLTASTFDTAKP